MSEKSGYTERKTDLLEGKKEIHYDAKDQKIGETIFATDFQGKPKQIHLDPEDRKTGETRRGQGRDEHFDRWDRFIGYSEDDTDFLGQPIQRHHDVSGGQVGVTYKTSRSREEHEGVFFKASLPRTKEPRAGPPKSEEHHRDYAGGGGVSSVEECLGGCFELLVGALFLMICIVVLLAVGACAGFAWRTEIRPALPMMLSRLRFRSLRDWLQAPFVLLALACFIVFSLLPALFCLESKEEERLLDAFLTALPGLFFSFLFLLVSLLFTA